MPSCNSAHVRLLPSVRATLLFGLAFTGLSAAQTAGAGSSVAGGLAHTCALPAIGGVQCWGLNDSGQLGDGSQTDRHGPVQVTGLPDEPIVAIDAGEAFTCAQTAAGNLYCWGENIHGQLGNGTQQSSVVPLAVTNLSGPVESFSLGTAHGCAIVSGGVVECWGYNGWGQLGDGSTFDRAVPEAVGGLAATSLIESVAAGQDHTCAATSVGDVLCWGDNFFGQVGDGTSHTRPLPERVFGLSGHGEPRRGLALQVAAGATHTCALTTSRQVLCWGENISGQLGNPVLQSQRIPALVSELDEPIEAIAAGDSFTCATSSLGAAWCWGENTDGQLALGHTVDRSTPTQVTRLGSAVVEIGLGAFHACAALATSGLYCWGDNFYGQLGDLSTVASAQPVSNSLIVFIDLDAVPAAPLPLYSRILLAAFLALAGGWLVHRSAGEPVPLS